MARKGKGLTSSFSWAKAGKAKLIANPTRTSIKRIYIVSSRRLKIYFVSAGGARVMFHICIRSFQASPSRTSTDDQ